ncbi:ceramidase domain-containing protein [Kibdelosporangium persicum]|uniref:Ceramidase n=1 Tax=Kibdelosporangium persicum TaxID=2698649 RepID=A0ABX2FCB7_9PSEU|nr:ceramidase domain-containing protein [Kibdelosporangium persicum]NRN68521.1 Ceramidase [Kibdelosporangium persicum]
MQRDYVDNYCERTDGSFWSEPLNAVSNLSFLIASIAAWLFIRRTARAAGKPAVELYALPVLIFVIFFGSSAFHTTATRWGLALDSGSIGVFMLYFIVLWARLYWDLPWSRAWIAAPAFLAWTVLISVLPLRMPGTYLAAVLGLLVLAGMLFWSRQPERRQHWRWYAVTALVFAVSLTSRTLDQPLCAELPIGTHYVWHTLNGVVLYLVTHAAVVRWRQVQGVSPEPLASR